MSDSQDQAVIIGCDDFEQPRPIAPPQSVGKAQKSQYSVRIKEFEKRKESFLMKEVQIYRVDVDCAGKSTLVLNRRFSDIELLFDVLPLPTQILRESYPGVILPGFPQNTLSSFLQAKMGLFDKDEFLGKRMQTLQHFLQRLLNMKELAECEPVRNFLGPDEQYELYRQSKSVTLKKKGIIGGAFQTASSYFKTKRVDSKYEKFQEAGQAVTRELQKLFTSVQDYIQINREELKADATLYEQAIDISSDPTTKGFIQRWDGALEATNRQLSNLIDELHEMLLDARMYASIIEQRYELKEQNEIEQVKQLQLNFQACKDSFLSEMGERIVSHRKTFMQLVHQLNARLKCLN